jgi:glucose-6-phosphate isomerase
VKGRTDKIVKPLQRIWAHIERRDAFMKLKFGGKIIEPEVRRLSQLFAVAFDTAWFASAPDHDAYFMYRDLALTIDDADAITSHRLRYDVTIIPPCKMGREFIKTYGHYHPRVNLKLPYTYPELYEVLDGEVHYLLQRAQSPKIVDDAILIKASPGDKVIIPPNYGHVTINPSERTLKMANWVCRTFESIYEPFTTLRGGAYYELIDGRLVRNRAYQKVSKIRIAYPAEVPDYGLFQQKSAYQLIEEPPLLEFLTAPERHTALFRELYRT